MKGVGAVLLAALAPLLGQEHAPIGILHGELAGARIGPAGGELTIRTAGDDLYLCTYNDKTYFERSRQRVAATSLRVGEKLELVTDRFAGSDQCYARTVHVVDPPPPRGRLRPFRNPTEHFVPRGNLTFSGVVMRVSPETLWLRTRASGNPAFLLREDTRFLEGGHPVGAARLNVNTRVFIRAGRNLEGDLEAYQIVWGEIFFPK